MHFVIPALIISASIIISGVITSWDSLPHSKNIIALEDGHINLGEIYYENAGQSILIENPEDGTVVAQLRTQKFDIDSLLEEEFATHVDVYNEELDEENRATTESLFFNTPLSIEYRGWVRYQAENHSRFELTITSETLDAESGELTIQEVIDHARNWQGDARPMIEQSFLLTPR